MVKFSFPAKSVHDIVPFLCFKSKRWTQFKRRKQRQTHWLLLWGSCTWCCTWHHNVVPVFFSQYCTICCYRIVIEGWPCTISVTQMARYGQYIILGIIISAILLPSAFCVTYFRISHSKCGSPIAIKANIDNYDVFWIMLSFHLKYRMLHLYGNIV